MKAASPAASSGARPPEGAAAPDAPFFDGGTLRVNIEQMRAAARPAAEPEVASDGGTVRVTPQELKEARRGVIDSPPTIPVSQALRSNVFVPVVPISPSEDVMSRSGAISRGVSRSDVVNDSDWNAPPPPTTAGAAPPAGSAPPLLDHHGDKMGADADLFVPPPSEIGVLRSASTSIVRGEQALSRRILSALPWALVSGAATWGAVELTLHSLAAQEPTLGATARLYFWIAPIVVGLLTIWLLLPRGRVLSDVGTHGVAFCDFRFRVWPPSRPPMNVLRFAQARDLRIAITHRPNVIDFVYEWRTAEGNPLYRLSRHCAASPDGQRPLKRGDGRYYDFCRAAERAWTLYVIEHAKAELARPGGHLTFPVYTPNCSALRIREGHVMFSTLKGSVPVEATDLRRVYVQDGQLHFDHPAGDIALPYADIGNVTVLLLVLHHHLGVEVN